MIWPVAQIRNTMNLPILAKNNFHSGSGFDEPFKPRIALAVGTFFAFVSPSQGEANGASNQRRNGQKMNSSVVKVAVLSTSVISLPLNVIVVSDPP